MFHSLEKNDIIKAFSCCKNYFSKKAFIVFAIGSIVRRSLLNGKATLWPIEHDLMPDLFFVYQDNAKSKLRQEFLRLKESRCFHDLLMYFLSSCFTCLCVRQRRFECQIKY